jgi:hypothetical protein
MSKASSGEARPDRDISIAPGGSGAGPQASTLADSGRRSGALAAAALVALAMLEAGCSSCGGPFIACLAVGIPDPPATPLPDAAARVPDGATTSPDAARDTATGTTDAGPPPARCDFARENGSGKITPDLAQAYASNPGPRGVLIGYHRQANIQPLPGCGDQRTCPERDAAVADLDRQVAEIQRCTVERIVAIGGVFLERFWLGNITHARLAAGQAQDIASLTDVRMIEDADAPGPPPP